MPTEPHYPAGHGWTPAGRFGPQRCKVLLARYPCPYPREEHDPTLPIEDVDFSGRRRKPKEVPMPDRATHCPSCGATVRSITREAGGRWSLSCGDWITDAQAATICIARGDNA